MTTITSKTIYNQPRCMATITSGEAGPTDVIELSDLPCTLPHCFASVRFFDGAHDPVEPSAGTLELEVQTIGNAPCFELPPDSTIDATAPVTLDWSANTVGIRITPTDLAGVTTWCVVLTFNMS